MAGSSTKSWWDYSRWMANIARNSRITQLEPTIELPLARSVLKVIWNPVLQTGTRSWLDKKFRRLSVNSHYGCNIDQEPVHIICKLLEAVGRDLKKIPMTDFESFGVALLIAANNRRYGTSPYYGGVSGAHVTIP